MISSHAVDFLAYTKNRELPVLMLDRAFDFVSHISREVLISDDWVFLDPFCVAGEVMLATASLLCAQRGDMNSVGKIGEFMHLQNRFHMLSPNVQSYYIVRKVFCSSNEYKARNIFNAAYMSKDGHKFDREAFRVALIEKIDTLIGKGKKIMVITCLPCQLNFNSTAKYIYAALTSLMVKSKYIDQMLLIAPERWFKDKEKFRHSREVRAGMLKYIRVKNSRWLFPHYGLREGLCYMHFDQSFEGEELTIDRGNSRRTLPITRGFTNKILSSVLHKIK